jgi:hypothetical protein
MTDNPHLTPMRKPEDIDATFLRLVCVLFGLLAFFPTSASACPADIFESHITRSRPVATIPAGAIQLKVDASDDEDELRSLSEGKVSLPVKEVLQGSYKEKFIEIDFTHQTSCDYFGPTGEDVYVVVYPLLYDEGDPVKDAEGKPMMDVIRYNASIDPTYLGKLAPFPDGATDIIRERKIFSCIRRGGCGDKATEICWDAENPDNIYRETSLRAYWFAAGLLILTGIAFIVKLKLKR